MCNSKNNLRTFNLKFNNNKWIVNKQEWNFFNVNRTLIPKYFYISLYFHSTEIYLLLNLSSDLFE
jgi:hypothetical protein